VLRGIAQEQTGADVTSDGAILKWDKVARSLDGPGSPNPWTMGSAEEAKKSREPRLAVAFGPREVLSSSWTATKTAAVGNHLGSGGNDANGGGDDLSHRPVRLRAEGSRICRLKASLN